MKEASAELARAIRDLALDAGVAIMAVYAGAFETRTKADASPVTDADEAAERLILEGLVRLAPGCPAHCLCAAIKGLL